MPILTLLEAPIELHFLVKGVLSPAITLFTSTLFLCGWITQAGIWLHCEVASEMIEESIPAWCPNTQQDPNSGQAKAFVGVFVAVAYCLYIGLAAGTIDRRNKRSTQMLPVVQKSSLELDCAGDPDRLVSAEALVRK